MSEKQDNPFIDFKFSVKITIASKTSMKNDFIHFL